jgi:uncharacterized glyoxalase superfamily protein PhnB
MSKPSFNSLTPILCVNDLVTSLKHYEKVLGFAKTWQWSEARRFDEPDMPSFACVTRGDCSVFLCEKGQGTPGAWICLNVPTRNDLDNLFKEYQASGAIILEEPKDRPWGMREMRVRDLDGNTFRIGVAVREQECG